jgi:hypothetical protein
MKTIYNKFIPFKGFKIMNFFGILFIRSEYKDRITEIDINHEKIHSAQMKELLYIPFYILYLIEWIIRLFVNNNAYKNISFEREAYANQKNLDYLKTRKHYSNFKYVRQSK